MAKILDCIIEVSVFELHLPYHVHFRTNTLGDTSSYPSSYGLNSITAVLQEGWLLEKKKNKPWIILMYEDGQKVHMMT